MKGKFHGQDDLLVWLVISASFSGRTNICTGEGLALPVVSKVVAEYLLWIFSDVLFLVQIRSKRYENENQDIWFSSATCLRGIVSDGVPWTDLLLSTTGIWLLWEQGEALQATFSSRKSYDECVCHIPCLVAQFPERAHVQVYVGLTRCRPDSSLVSPQ